ncbi:MAG: hypothetical protein HXY41_07835 [Chloroflexi bacterium]|nr:hypothetical protein [Chloroflexota bacterium]
MPYSLGWLQLISEDPRTEEEIERDLMREAESLTYRMFDEQPAAPEAAQTPAAPDDVFTPAGARYEGQRHPLRQVIQTQARRLAAFLRGERDDYMPYKAEW